MIPRLKPNLGWSEFFSALNVFNQKSIDLFENLFSKVSKQKYSVAFPYGRTGLVALLKSFDLKGKEIICPAYTCVVVPHAIVTSGNIPVFVDSNVDDFNMNLKQVEAKISANTGAIIATSLFGHPVDLETLEKIKKKHPQIKIIQDCAHSFFAEKKGVPVQTVADAAIYGLNISKIVTSVFGGMVSTDSHDLYLKLKNYQKNKLKSSKLKAFKRFFYLLAVYFAFNRMLYGVINYLERKNLLNRFVKYYDDSLIDMPKDYLVRMTALEARVGLCNLSRYTQQIKLRREAANYYCKNLNNSKDFKLPPIIEGATYSHFVVQVPNKKKWLEWALQSGVQLGELIEYNIPEMKAYGSHSPEKFPNSAYYARHCINLPVWGGKIMAEKVIKFCNNYKSLTNFNN